jgi:hypothetical protein
MHPRTSVPGAPEYKSISTLHFAFCSLRDFSESLHLTHRTSTHMVARAQTRRHADTQTRRHAATQARSHADPQDTQARSLEGTQAPRQFTALSLLFTLSRHEDSKTQRHPALLFLFTSPFHKGTKAQGTPLHPSRSYKAHHLTLYEGTRLAASFNNSPHFVHHLAFRLFTLASECTSCTLSTSHLGS